MKTLLIYFPSECYFTEDQGEKIKKSFGADEVITLPNANVIEGVQYPRFEVIETKKNTSNGGKDPQAYLEKIRKERENKNNA